MSTFYAAIYEHPHGTDVRLFRDEAHAWSWRTNIAKDWWNDAIGGERPADAKIGDRYFDSMGDHGEYFSVTPCTPEGSDPAHEHLPTPFVRVVLEFSIAQDTGDAAEAQMVSQAAADAAESAIRSRLFSRGFLPGDILIGAYAIRKEMCARV